MPKPNKGKTKTIKKRAIYVYLPSQKMADEWKSKAEKGGNSISKFVIERVEDSIRKEEEQESYLNRLELIKKLNAAEEELKQLRKDNRLLKQLVDNLDTELKRYRAKPFLEEDFKGIRRFDKELIDLLKHGGSLSGDEILSRLSIDSSETDLVQAINKQLEVLESYGLVEYSGRGWKWKA
jgi:predicted RNase H-like nuclease (RuvC/YqgF family)